MNIKSYLKGIGVGMIVASLVLIIAGKYRMTDDQVIKRAEELGYTKGITVTVSDMQPKPEIVVDDASNQDEDTIVEEKNNSDKKPETTEDNNIKEDTVVEDVTADDSAETTETVESSETTEVVDSTESTESTEVVEDVISNGETVKVEVKSGMSSESVSFAVKNAGLVESDIEFNKYLCENGYDKRLRVGSFDIPSGSDFETISKYLCGIK